MKTNLDVLLAALYVFIDDHVAPCRRIGRPPRLTDSELLCLAVAQVLLGFPSARHWIRFAHDRLAHLFRYLPQQSAYNKRLNAAGPLISHTIRDARPAGAYLRHRFEHHLRRRHRRRR
ncbi:hypothetical protein [Streptomyces sp. 891-h]|uniref:hypothetical protein n=1 Tax=Streptomyces sp. 891-h TaxID=2720714 RepID=UPI001FAA921D|nr:hypothetical protein [Streptomyces sp. 891-h]